MSRMEGLERRISELRGRFLCTVGEARMQLVDELCDLEGELSLDCPRCERDPRQRGGRYQAEERYSLGLPAGRWCDPCWSESGYRKDGPEGFDPLDAGEHYE